MTYSLKQIQNTIHYIVAQCRDDTERGLSSSQRRWLEKELMVALDPLQQKNKKLIVIHPTNKALTNFFLSVVEQKISFPSDTTYLIYRRGDSYEKNHGQKTEIYNKARVKSKHASRRITELQDQLEAMTLVSDDERASSSDEADDLFTVPPTFTPAKQNTLKHNGRSGVQVTLEPEMSKENRSKLFSF